MTDDTQNPLREQLVEIVARALADAGVWDETVAVTGEEAAAAVIDALQIEPLIGQTVDTPIPASRLFTLGVLVESPQ